MIAKLTLEPGEYIVDGAVKMYGQAPYFVIRFILGPILSVITIFTGYWLWKVISRAKKPNPALHDIPVYHIASKIYEPIAIFALLVLVYFFISTYTEKVILTNKAILRRNVFSITRIYFGDITNVITAYEQFNFNQQSRANSFILGLLLGINWQVNIEAANNRYLLLKNMSKGYALELKAKLVEARSQSLMDI